MGAGMGARSVTLRGRSSFVFGTAALVAAAFVIVLVVGAAPSVTRAATGFAAGPTSREQAASSTTATEIAPETRALPTEVPPAPPRWTSLSSTQAVEMQGAKVILAPAGSEPLNANGPRPKVATMLHGMCSDVEWSCEAVQASLPDGFVLACPTGNASCGDRADWTGDGETKARHLDDVVGRALRSVDLGDAQDGSEILMGFSRGAFVARDVAYARKHKYRALVLIGAAITPDPAILRDNGIEKVVLASGDFDGAAKTMRAARKKLTAAGFDCRFVSLGRVYHALPSDSGERLREAMAWAAR
ncbi:MAG: hypothetical protein HOW73_46775 [Polyangiaceae bacterium]|nr:hypothetical protein [Polyangiaceae bacterium]